MVNISPLPLALVTSLVAFGEARNCTPKLNYCGSVLLDIGKKNGAGDGTTVGRQYMLIPTFIKAYTFLKLQMN